jgi:uncharacterized membrane protein
MSRSNQRGHSLVPSLALVACAVLFVWVTSLTLPSVVASHFGASGEANGFMPRQFYVWLMLAIFAAVVLALVVLPNRIFRNPDARINLPNREYWLAAERRAETIEILSRQSVRFSAMLLVFLCYAHWLVVLANAVSPPRLSSPWFVGGLVVFMLATLAWVISLLGRFRNVPR